MFWKCLWLLYLLVELQVLSEDIVSDLSPATKCISEFEDNNRLENSLWPRIFVVGKPTRGNVRAALSRPAAAILGKNCSGEFVLGAYGSSVAETVVTTAHRLTVSKYMSYGIGRGRSLVGKTPTEADRALCRGILEQQRKAFHILNIPDTEIAGIRSSRETREKLSRKQIALI